MIVREEKVARAGGLTFRMGKVLDSHPYMYLLSGTHIILNLNSDEAIQYFKECAQSIVNSVDTIRIGCGCIDIHRHEEQWREGVVTRYVVFDNGNVVGVIDGKETFKLILTLMEPHRGPAHQIPA